MDKIELHPDFKDFLKLLNSRGVNDLKKNKKASGRYKNLDDLEHLP